MNYRFQHALIIAVLASGASTAFTGDTAAESLAAVVLCQRESTPAEFGSLIAALGGHAIVGRAGSEHVQYALPAPITIVNRPLRRFTIEPRSNADGDFFAYGAQVPDAVDQHEVARAAAIPSDLSGKYRKRIGGADLAIESSRGIVALTCSQNVRTWAKRLRRDMAGLAGQASSTHSMNGNTLSP